MPTESNGRAALRLRSCGRRSRRGLPSLVGVVLSALLVVGVAAACGDDDDEAAPTTTAQPGNEESTTTTELEPVSIKIGAAPAVVSTPLYVAQNEGIFEEEGLDVEFVVLPSSTAISQAMLAGEVHFASVPLENAVALNLQGQEVMGVVGLHNRSASFLVAREGIELADSLNEAVEQFRGLRIGVTAEGSSSARVVRTLMRDVGLNPDTDASIVAVGFTEGLAALRAGQVDVISTGEPVVSTVVLQGVGYIVADIGADAGESLSYAGGVMLEATRKYHDENRDVIERAIRAVNRAQELIDEDPDVAVEALLANIPEMARETAEAIIEQSLPKFDPVFTDENLQADIGQLTASGDYENVDDAPTFDEIMTDLKDMWGS